MKSQRGEGPPLYPLYRSDVSNLASPLTFKPEPRQLYDILPAMHPMPFVSVTFA